MDHFKYMIGGTTFTAHRIRVRDFINIMIASADLERAGNDLESRCNAFIQIADSLADISQPRPDFDPVSLMNIAELASEMWAWSLGPSEKADPEDKEGAPERRRFSRAELMVPIYKVAYLLHEPIKSLMEMEMGAFNEHQRIVDATWADVRLDMAEVAILPHLTDKDRKRLTRKLQEKVGGLKPEDHNPWRSHIDQYRQRLDASEQ